MLTEWYEGLVTAVFVVFVRMYYGLGLRPVINGAWAPGFQIATEEPGCVHARGNCLLERGRSRAIRTWSVWVLKSDERAPCETA